jgi:hypothetical protein
MIKNLIRLFTQLITPRLHLLPPLTIGRENTFMAFDSWNLTKLTFEND